MRDGTRGSKPILFSAPMVRAIIDGRKTQTRRVVKPQPGFDAYRESWKWESRHASAWWSGPRPVAAALLGFRDQCPFGQPGDRLWVREPWGLCSYTDPTDFFRGRYRNDGTLLDYETVYRADWGANQEACFWRPSIHLPRWFSRITLEVTEVRIERLHDIESASAEQEGVMVPPVSYAVPEDPRVLEFERECALLDGFRALWESINGAGSWDADPWVWVVEFKRVEA